MSSLSAKRRKNYSSCDVSEAISKVETGNISRSKSVHDYGIPRQTLSMLCKKKRENVTAKRPDPAPVLGAEAEDDLVHWSLVMQKHVLPVVWDMIIQKSQ